MLQAPATKLSSAVAGEVPASSAALDDPDPGRYQVSTLLIAGPQRPLTLPQSAYLRAPSGLGVGYTQCLWMISLCWMWEEFDSPQMLTFLVISS